MQTSHNIGNFANVATWRFATLCLKNVKNKIEIYEPPKLDCHSLTSYIYTDNKWDNVNNLSKILEK